MLLSITLRKLLPTYNIEKFIFAKFNNSLLTKNLLNLLDNEEIVSTIENQTSKFITAVNTREDLIQQIKIKNNENIKAARKFLCRTPDDNSNTEIVYHYVTIHNILLKNFLRNEIAYLYVVELRDKSDNALITNEKIVNLSKSCRYQKEIVTDVLNIACEFLLDQSCSHKATLRYGNYVRSSHSLVSNTLLNLSQMGLDGMSYDSTDYSFKDQRVVRYDLVYISNIPYVYNDENILQSLDFFGQFGKIKKVVLVPNKKHDAPIKAYITYSTKAAASWCIQDVDQSILDGHVLTCTYGTTKFCSYFLQNTACTNGDCMYLHSMNNGTNIYNKDDLYYNKPKLHNYEPRFKSLVRIGKRQRFEMIDELISFKNNVIFKVPNKITFEPYYCDFDNN